MNKVYDRCPASELRNIEVERLHKILHWRPTERWSSSCQLSEAFLIVQRIVMQDAII
jgi:hypothetical protein